MPNIKSEVLIKPTKGRQMLTWVGKHPLRTVVAYPAQLVETFSTNEENKLLDSATDWTDWPDEFPHSGMLFHGDNIDVMAYLLANGFRGKIRVIYIDPPFDSGADYIRKIELRGLQSKDKLPGESYGIGEQTQYTDIWANDNYLQFMFERLLLMKELLSENGVIFVHLNHERVHLIRCLLDEVFGSENFRNDIVWKHGPGKSHPEYFGRVKDTILFYCKSKEYVWNKQFIEVSEKYKASFKKKDERGYYVTQPLHSGKPAKNVPVWRGIRPPGGRGWAYKIETLDEFEAQGKIEWSDDGIPRLKRYLDEVSGAVVQDIWDDIIDVASPELLQAFYTFLDEVDQSEYSDTWSDISAVLDRSGNHLGYPTQKPEQLVNRIISATSNPGDIILDCFIGSGTTAAVAQKLGRRWIVADINKGAIQTTTKRLQSIMYAQIASAISPGRQLPGLEDQKNTLPRQLSFNVYRVNDYDLQIQHNEAFNIAVEHLGITRTKTDSFFDGTLGKKLVKIIPFNHPLSPLDMEGIKNELSNRPDESRDIVVVCLGTELAVKVWIDDWNRLRRQSDFPNKIDVIELRTDPKVGGFFVHEPDQAVVKFERQEENVCITIENFLSPTIIQRLEQQSAGPLLKPQITDWRSMVDSVMIDANYDGQVFNITLSDIPEKKNDLVEGKYRIMVPSGAEVAVKITDMLGEEVLVSEKI